MIIKLGDQVMNAVKIEDTNWYKFIALSYLFEMYGYQLRVELKCVEKSADDSIPSNYILYTNASLLNAVRILEVSSWNIINIDNKVLDISSRESRFNLTANVDFKTFNYSQRIVTDCYGNVYN